MAIDIKSLRIGSHILVDGVRARVAQLNTISWGKKPAYHVWARGASPDDGVVREVGCLANDDAIEPIPITPDLLKELSGFEYHEYDNGNLWEWRFDDLYKACGYLEFDDDDTLTWRGRLWRMDEIETDFRRVRYLHELENLFYMFYEKELIPD